MAGESNPVSNVLQMLFVSDHICTNAEDSCNVKTRGVAGDDNISVILPRRTDFL